MYCYHQQTKVILFDKFPGSFVPCSTIVILHLANFSIPFVRLSLQLRGSQLLISISQQSSGLGDLYSPLLAKNSLMKIIQDQNQILQFNY